MAYFYQHSEGHVIEKPDIVVDRGGGPLAYFTGPFVKCWWQESDLLRPERAEYSGRAPMHRDWMEA